MIKRSEKSQNTWLPGAKNVRRKYKIPGYLGEKRSEKKKRKNVIPLAFIYLCFYFVYL